MGTYTDYHGTLGIEPPLTWPEIQQSEAWAGHPDHYTADFPARVRHGVRLVVSERNAIIESGEYAGSEVTVRWCDKVEIVGEELRHDGVMWTLGDLARRFGDTHHFTGFLECRQDHPDVETPFRVRIHDIEVVEYWPVMFWWDEPAVADGIRKTIGDFDRSIDERAKLAQAVLDHLIKTYAKNG